MLVTNPDGPEARSCQRSDRASRAGGDQCGLRKVGRFAAPAELPGQCHLQGKVPRETDVAFDVFRRDASFDGTHDAVVRVAARTLRQKMDEYYREAGQGRPLRFELPRGSYRIVVVPAQDRMEGTAAGATTRTAVSPGTNALPDMAAASSGPPARLIAPAMWLAAGLAILAAASLFYSGNRNPAPRGSARQPARHRREPTLATAARQPSPHHHRAGRPAAVPESATGARARAADPRLAHQLARAAA